jgi:hypothetical protein
MIGYSKCPSWLRKKYILAVKGICQDCKKSEDEVGKLFPHRIIRSWQGGLYTLYPLNHPKNNVRVLCKKCHFLHHANEFRRIKSN